MKFERTLIKLAMAYRNGNWRTRRLYRGRAERLLLSQSFSLLTHSIIWAEWLAIANSPKPQFNLRAIAPQS